MAGNWPESVPLIDQLFDGVPEEERQRIVCDNAREFFKLDQRVLVS